METNGLKLLFQGFIIYSPFYRMKALEYLLETPDIMSMIPEEFLTNTLSTSIS